MDDRVKPDLGDFYAPDTSPFRQEDYTIGELYPAEEALPTPGGDVSSSSSSSEAEENQNYTSNKPFAITVNGSTDEDGSQTSPFTINCNNGTGQYPGEQSVSFSGGGVSVSPGVGIGDVKIYKVIASVTASIGGDGEIQVSSSGSIDIEEASTSEVAGSNTRYKYTGIKEYTFYILIGSVTARRLKSDQYRITITQIQNGNYTYGSTEGGSVTSGSTTVKGNAGPRTVILCINGEPFECEIEISGLRKPS